MKEQKDSTYNGANFFGSKVRGRVSQKDSTSQNDSTFSRVIDLLKAISPVELVNHKIISPAPNHRDGSLKGFICPLCGSGTRGGC